MCLVTVCVFLYTLFYTPFQIGAFEWTDSLPDGTQLEVCEGNSATFPWGFHIAPGERADNVSHHQQLQYETQDMADESGQEDGMGKPIVSTDPHFSFTPDHQMIINRVTVKDTGNYVIKAMVVQAGEIAAQPHVTRASLLVKVSPVVDNGGLQAKLQPQAIMVTDGPTPGRHVKLSCGTFLNLGHPAVTVTWTTPSGTFLPSTSYENGLFSLIVPNPVESGDYSCQVDPRAPALGCVGNKSPLRHQAAVRVDAIRAGKIRKTRDKDLTEPDKDLIEHVVEMTSRVIELTARMEELASFVYSSSCNASKARYPLSGVQTLNIGVKRVQVYCDQETEGGGWTVIQRRQNGRVSFYRGWDDYVRGFGDVNNEYWLGLDNIYRLSIRATYTLRVDLWDYNGTWVWAEYGRFSLDASDNYRLHISGYNGTAGDSMLDTGNAYTSAVNMSFSTHDRDNDPWPPNCAQSAYGAWWYNRCHYSNLNGWYYADGRQVSRGLIWFNYKNDVRSFVRTEMKIRPQG